MADHANLLVLKGHLAADPKFNSTHGGKDVANIFVATNAPSYKDGTGEWRNPPAEFCSISVFVPKSVEALRALKKGDPIEVRASVGLGEYTDKATGEVRKVHEIKVSNRFLGHLVKRREVAKAGDAPKPSEGAQ